MNRDVHSIEQQLFDLHAEQDRLSRRRAELMRTNGSPRARLVECVGITHRIDTLAQQTRVLRDRLTVARERLALAMGVAA